MFNGNVSPQLSWKIVIAPIDTMWRTYLHLTVIFKDETTKSQLDPMQLKNYYSFFKRF
jgi:hypothetical protein